MAVSENYNSNFVTAVLFCIFISAITGQPQTIKSAYEDAEESYQQNLQDTGIQNYDSDLNDIHYSGHPPKYDNISLDNFGKNGERKYYNEFISNNYNSPQRINPKINNLDYNGSNSGEQSTVLCKPHHRGKHIIPSISESFGNGKENFAMNHLKQNYYKTFSNYVKTLENYYLESNSDNAERVLDSYTELIDLYKNMYNLFIQLHPNESVPEPLISTLIAAGVISRNNRRFSPFGGDEVDSVISLPDILFQLINYEEAHYLFKHGKMYYENLLQIYRVKGSNFYDKVASAYKILSQIYEIYKHKYYQKKSTYSGMEFLPSQPPEDSRSIFQKEEIEQQQLEISVYIEIRSIYHLILAKYYSFLYELFDSETDKLSYSIQGVYQLTMEIYSQYKSIYEFLELNNSLPNKEYLIKLIPAPHYPDFITNLPTGNPTEIALLKYHNSAAAEYYKTLKEYLYLVNLYNEQETQENYFNAYFKYELLIEYYTNYFEIYNILFEDKIIEKYNSPELPDIFIHKNYNIGYDYLIKEYNKEKNKYEILLLNFKRLIDIYTRHPEAIGYYEISKAYIKMKKYYSIYKVLHQYVSKNSGIQETILQLPQPPPLKSGEEIHFPVIDTDYKASADVINKYAQTYELIVKRYYFNLIDFTSIVNIYQKNKPKELYNIIVKAYNSLRESYNLIWNLYTYLLSVQDIADFNLPSQLPNMTEQQRTYDDIPSQYIPIVKEYINIKEFFYSTELQFHNLIKHYINRDITINDYLNALKTYRKLYNLYSEYKNTHIYLIKNNIFIDELSGFPTTIPIFVLTYPGIPNPFNEKDQESNERFTIINDLYNAIKQYYLLLFDFEEKLKLYEHQLDRYKLLLEIQMQIQTQFEHVQKLLSIAKQKNIIISHIKIPEVPSIEKVDKIPGQLKMFYEINGNKIRGLPADVFQVLENYKTTTARFIEEQIKYTTIIENYKKYVSVENYLSIIKELKNLLDIYKFYYKLHIYLSQLNVLNFNSYVIPLKFPELKVYHPTIYEILNTGLKPEMQKLIDSYSNIINNYFISYFIYQELSKTLQISPSQESYIEILEAIRTIKTNTELYFKFYKKLREFIPIGTPVIEQVPGIHVIAPWLNGCFKQSTNGQSIYSPEIAVIIQRYTDTINEYYLLMIDYANKIREYKINNSKQNMENYETVLYIYRLLMAKHKIILDMNGILLSQNIFLQEKCKKVPDHYKFIDILPPNDKLFIPENPSKEILKLIAIYKIRVSSYYILYLNYKEAVQKFEIQKSPELYNYMMQLYQELLKSYVNYQTIIQNLIQNRLKDKQSILILPDLPNLKPRPSHPEFIPYPPPTPNNPTEQDIIIVQQYFTKLNIIYKSVLDTYLKILDIFKTQVISPEKLNQQLTNVYIYLNDIYSYLYKVFIYLKSNGIMIEEIIPIPIYKYRPEDIPKEKIELPQIPELPDVPNPETTQIIKSYYNMLINLYNIIIKQYQKNLYLLKNQQIPEQRVVTIYNYLTFLYDKLKTFDLYQLKFKIEHTELPQLPKLYENPTPHPTDFVPTTRPTVFVPTPPPDVVDFPLIVIQSFPKIPENPSITDLKSIAEYYFYLKSMYEYLIKIYYKKLEQYNISNSENFYTYLMYIQNIFYKLQHTISIIKIYDKKFKLNLPQFPIKIPERPVNVPKIITSDKNITYIPVEIYQIPDLPSRLANKYQEEFVIKYYYYLKEIYLNIKQMYDVFIKTYNSYPSKQNTDILIKIYNDLQKIKQIHIIVNEYIRKQRLSVELFEVVVPVPPFPVHPQSPTTEVPAAEKLIIFIKQIINIFQQILQKYQYYLKIYSIDQSIETYDVLRKLYTKLQAVYKKYTYFIKLNEEKGWGINLPNLQLPPLPIPPTQHPTWTMPTTQPTTHPFQIWSTTRPTKPTWIWSTTQSTESTRMQPTTQPTEHPPWTWPTTQPTEHPPWTWPTTQPTEHPPWTWPTTQPTEHPPWTWPTTQPTEHPPWTQPTTQQTEHPPWTQPTTQPTEQPPWTWPTTQPTQSHTWMWSTTQPTQSQTWMWSTTQQTRYPTWKWLTTQSPQPETTQTPQTRPTFPTMPTTEVWTPIWNISTSPSSQNITLQPPTSTTPSTLPPDIQPTTFYPHSSSTISPPTDWHTETSFPTQSSTIPPQKPDYIPIKIPPPPEMPPNPNEENVFYIHNYLSELIILYKDLLNKYIYYLNIYKTNTYIQNYDILLQIYTLLENVKIHFKKVYTYVYNLKLDIPLENLQLPPMPELPDYTPTMTPPNPDETFKPPELPTVPEMPPKPDEITVYMIRMYIKRIKLIYQDILFKYQYYLNIYEINPNGPNYNILIEIYKILEKVNKIYNEVISYILKLRLEIQYEKLQLPVLPEQPTAPPSEKPDETYIPPQLPPIPQMPPNPTQEDVYLINVYIQKLIKMFNEFKEVYMKRLVIYLSNPEQNNLIILTNIFQDLKKIYEEYLSVSLYIQTQQLNISVIELQLPPVPVKENQPGLPDILEKLPYKSVMIKPPPEMPLNPDEQSKYSIEIYYKTLIEKFKETLYYYQQYYNEYQLNPNQILYDILVSIYNDLVKIKQQHDIIVQFISQNQVQVVVQQVVIPQKPGFSITNIIPSNQKGSKDAISDTDNYKIIYSEFQEVLKQYIYELQMVNNNIYNDQFVSLTKDLVVKYDAYYKMHFYLLGLNLLNEEEQINFLLQPHYIFEELPVNITKPPIITEKNPIIKFNLVIKNYNTSLNNFNSALYSFQYQRPKANDVYRIVSYYYDLIINYVNYIKSYTELLPLNLQTTNYNLPDLPNLPLYIQMNLIQIAKNNKKNFNKETIDQYFSDYRKYRKYYDEGLSGYYKKLNEYNKEKTLEVYIKLHEILQKIFIFNKMYYSAYIRIVITGTEINSFYPIQSPYRIPKPKSERSTTHYDSALNEYYYSLMIFYKVLMHYHESGSEQELSNLIDHYKNLILTYKSLIGSFDATTDQLEESFATIPNLPRFVASPSKIIDSEQDDDSNINNDMVEPMYRKVKFEYQRALYNYYTYLNDYFEYKTTESKINAFNKYAELIDAYENFFEIYISYRKGKQKYSFVRIPASFGDNEQFVKYFVSYFNQLGFSENAHYQNESLLDSPLLERSLINNKSNITDVNTLSKINEYIGNNNEE